MSGAQGIGERRHSPDLSVDPSEYFGAPVSDIENADTFGLRPQPEKDLYRVQYLYLLVFGNSGSSTEYGGIQVRASTHLYLEDGRVPIRLQKVMQRAAHRGAHLFDSSLQNPKYGGGGRGWSDTSYTASESGHKYKTGDAGYSGSGGGYLSGFTPVENGGEYRNWEVEPVGVPDDSSRLEATPRGSTPGVIEWTTEVYLEVEGTDYADLSGVAQGLCDPYHLTGHDVPPDEPVSAQQEWWEVTFNDAKNAYDIHPQGDTPAKRRAKEIRGKDVYLNGLHIGTVVKDGRVWLKKEYDERYGMKYRGDHSKESVVAKTSAYPQSIRGTTANPGKLAKVDESPSAVHLATADFRPDDFDPTDPGDVDPGREVHPGSPGGHVNILSLPEDVDDPTRQICRQDQELIDHLGYSTPPYEHTYAEMWRWPGFRSIAEHGRVTRPEDQRPDDQTGLDAHGGADE